jgi:hypothetical protein
MKKTLRRRKLSRVSIRSGQVEFVKVGTDACRWRDVYRLGIYIGLNLLFAFVRVQRRRRISAERSVDSKLRPFFPSRRGAAYGGLRPASRYRASGVGISAAMSAPLFRRQENHPRKLEHRGNKLNNDPGEEWPERAEQDDVK